MKTRSTLLLLLLTTAAQSQMPPPPNPTEDPAAFAAAEKLQDAEMLLFDLEMKAFWIATPSLIATKNARDTMLNLGLQPGVTFEDIAIAGMFSQSCLANITAGFAQVNAATPDLVIARHFVGLANEDYTANDWAACETKCLVVDLHCRLAKRDAEAAVPTAAAAAIQLENMIPYWVQPMPGGPAPP